MFLTKKRKGIRSMFRFMTGSFRFLLRLLRRKTDRSPQSGTADRGTLSAFLRSIGPFSVAGGEDRPLVLRPRSGCVRGRSADPLMAARCGKACFWRRKPVRPKARPESGPATGFLFRRETLPFRAACRGGP